MHRIRRRSASVITAAAMALAAVPVAAIVLAEPAFAATSCTSNTTRTSGGFRFTLPSTGSGSLNCILAVGNQSVAVRNLQAHLNACYRSGLSVDGIYGSRTKAAVQSVQRSVNIDDDGIYGPITRSKMKWLADNGTTGQCRVFGA
jgi:peptidoglycan hydrolase-like protein with peptidoglycan-binding domain